MARVVQVDQRDGAGGGVCKILRAKMLSEPECKLPIRNFFPRRMVSGTLLSGSEKFVVKSQPTAVWNESSHTPGNSPGHQEVSGPVCVRIGVRYALPFRMRVFSTGDSQHHQSWLLPVPSFFVGKLTPFP